MADTNKSPEHRRKGGRRAKSDRREEVRFEPDREQRRKNHGRRKEDLLVGRRP